MSRIKGTRCRRFYELREHRCRVVLDRSWNPKLLPHRIQGHSSFQEPTSCLFLRSRRQAPSFFSSDKTGPRKPRVAQKSANTDVHPQDHQRSQFRRFPPCALFDARLLGCPHLARSGFNRPVDRLFATLASVAAGRPSSPLIKPHLPARDLSKVSDSANSSSSERHIVNQESSDVAPTSLRQAKSTHTVGSKPHAQDPEPSTPPPSCVQSYCRTQ